MAPPTSEDIAWTAGLIEGEGYFATKDHSRRVIAVEMTDLDILERLRGLWGGNIWQQRKRKAHWKDSWKWTLYGTNAYSLTKLILPYLGKRRTVQAATLVAGYESSALRQANARVAQTISKARELRSSGLTHQEIANKLGYDRSHISKLLRR